MVIGLPNKVHVFVYHYYYITLYIYSRFLFLYLLKKYLSPNNPNLPGLTQTGPYMHIVSGVEIQKKKRNIRTNKLLSYGNKGIMNGRHNVSIS